MALGWAGGLVILLTMVGVGLMFAFDISLAQVFRDAWEELRRFWAWLRKHWPLRRLGKPKAILLELEKPKPSSTQPTVAPQQHFKESLPRREPPVVRETAAPSSGELQGQHVPQWELPRIEDVLIESDEEQMSLSDIREKARIIEETLNSFGVPVTVVEVNPGPVVTQFGLEPGYIERRDRQGRVKRVKVKVSRIAALSNDLALALAASPIRIEAPVPGKGVVGLEVPNSETAIVGLRSVLESEEFRAIASSPLAVGLGRDVSGRAVVDDLARLPHLLIAGATGSGKSVCINALIACLLCRNTPDELKLVMIDPKRVELSGYNGIPHLLAPVVVELERVVGVLRWAEREMDRRYRTFAKVGARNIQAYNEMALDRGEEKMPYIVIFIDELADLMMVAPDEVERSICRIAQMARAVGMHLVIATQRPSVDVVTGLIKANFPARISFAVSSQVDSRVILDSPGAEKLLGRGDALYMAPDSPKLIRIQGAYVSDAEIARLVSFWRGQLARRVEAHVPPPQSVDLSSVEQRPLWPELEEEEKRE
ncbi:MAG: DNA translocase FtsK, partial [Anaerolineae bacterium]|nr:DNA translocase FtsK [Anaerolineae bacterium]